MKQLELRFYSRAEIAEVLSVNLNDGGHFKRNVENKLSKSGYSFRYINRQGVEIISKPETPEERLSEIIYRGFGMDIQIHPIQFACFIAAFTDIKGFSSTPWARREKQYYKYYGYSVDQRTMRNWCSQLINRGVMTTVGHSTAWRTYFIGDRKIREPIEEIDKVEMQNYFERRNKIFHNHYKLNIENGESQKEAAAKAWKDTYKKLWAEFGCCYYYCKNFVLSRFAYNDVDVMEIYELARELATAAPQQDESDVTASDTQEGFVF